MSTFQIPTTARAAPAPSRVDFQLAASCFEPPADDGWLYELKHDGHRLAALSDGRGALRLLSRNGHERTRLFGPAFTGLGDLGRTFVLDGEIAAPDGAGVTHLDDLQAAIMKRQPHRLAYFAFDLLHLDSHDLRGCALIDRKALLAELVATATCPRLVYVDYIEADGDRLLDAVRAIGGEGIVAKRAAGRYRPGLSRVWLVRTAELAALNPAANPTRDRQLQRGREAALAFIKARGRATYDELVAHLEMSLIFESDPTLEDLIPPLERNRRGGMPVVARGDGR